MLQLQVFLGWVLLGLRAKTTWLGFVKNITIWRNIHNFVAMIAAGDGPT